MDLIRYDARSGMKDLSIVVESIWTSNGNEPEPEAPPSYDAAVVPNSTPTPLFQYDSLQHQRIARTSADNVVGPTPSPMRTPVKLGLDVPSSNITKCVNHLQQSYKPAHRIR
jgi:hypothetical protein